MNNSQRFSFIDSTSIFDKILFNPISNSLITFFRYLNFTPNQLHIYLHYVLLLHFSFILFTTKKKHFYI